MEASSKLENEKTEYLNKKSLQLEEDIKGALSTVETKVAEHVKGAVDKVGEEDKVPQLTGDPACPKFAPLDSPEGKWIGPWCDGF